MNRRSASMPATPRPWVRFCESWLSGATRSSWSNTILRSSSRLITSLNLVLNQAIKADRLCARPPITLFSSIPSHSPHNICEGNEPYPSHPNVRSGSGKIIQFTGVNEQNLKNLTVTIPLGTLVCITGPSGSGKSTLAEATIYAALARFFKVDTPPQPHMEGMTGTEHLRTVCLIDQEPIGKTPRSNPITYIKAYDEIRALYSPGRRTRAPADSRPRIFPLIPGKADAPAARAMDMKNWKCIFSRISMCLARNCEGNDFRIKFYRYHQGTPFMTC